MENCYITTTHKGSKFEILLFCLFGMKRFLYKKIVKKNKLFFIFIPLPSFLKEKQKRRYFKNLCKLFHKMNIKNICVYNIKDDKLLYELKKEFYILKGDSVFYEYFDDILIWFSQKIGYPLQECELSLVSNYPNEAKKYILKVIKSVKSIVIYTTKPDNFKKLIEEMKNQYGIYITLKNKEEKVKKYKKIYVNLDPTPIFKKNFFHAAHLIDIYKIYKGALNDVIFFYTTKEDDILKEKKIVKNLSFTEYYEKEHHFDKIEENSTKKLKKKQYKIVNIVK